MINLLPNDIKQDIGYARRNARLRLWIISSLIAFAGMGAIIGGGFLYLQQSTSSYSKQLEVAQQNLQAQDVSQTQKRVEEISSNTKLTTQVLSREILFSKLIKQIGSTLPAGTALKSLEIDKVQGGIQLNAGAVDYNAGTQIQVNLQDPKNGVFEKADINSIKCGLVQSAQEPTATFYPCEVELRALFSKNNSYVYIAPTPAPAGGQN